jgi:arylsulfatase A-like enzyme
MPQQPNIILLVGEDTGRHQRCYGDRFAQTPNIDRLAAEGCLFTNACSTAPVCAPSRSTLIMGQFANKVGSHHMRSTVVNPPRLFTHELRDAGYHVNWANKTDFNFEPPEDFADEHSDWITALEQGDYPKNKPFFNYFNFGMTHESCMWPPAGKDSHPIPVDEPGIDPALLQGIEVPPYLPDSPEVRSGLYRYYQQLHEQDRQIGRVLDALDQQELADNTIVIYMTDHGRGMPREKRWLYDAGIHLPLIIRAPGLTTAGSFCEELVSWVDIAPTLLSLVGVAIPKTYDGRVFMGANKQTQPRCIFAGRDRMDECFDRVRAARSRRYLYLRNDFPQLPWAQRLRYMEMMPATRQMRQRMVDEQLSWPADVFMQATKPAEELYDIIADPHCVHNLAGDARFGEVLDLLGSELSQWIKRIGDKGYTTERQLIAQGIVQNRLDEEYALRVEPLPEAMRMGGVYDTRLTQEDV